MNKYTLKFTDAENEVCTIAKHGKYFFIKPLFLQAKAMSEAQFNEILEMKIDCDGVLHTCMPYDDFFGRYYNYNSPVVKKAYPRKPTKAGKIF